MHCPHCATVNPEAGHFCTHCGRPLAEPTPEERTLENFRAILGPNNQEYYLQRFADYEASGKSSLGWHWPAFFITFYWLLYRKMWLAALLYFILPYLCTSVFGLITSLLGESRGLMMLGGYLAYTLAILLLPPLLANGLYYRHCQSKIRQAEQLHDDRERQLGYLRAKGGTSHVMLFVVLIVGFIAVIGILAAIAIPAYHDYTLRSKMSGVYQSGQAITQELTQYYAEHQALPTDIHELAIPTLPNWVSGVQLDSNQGVLELQLAPPGTGQSLQFVAHKESNGILSWRCQSQTIPVRSLPQACR